MTKIKKTLNDQFYGLGHYAEDWHAFKKSLDVNAKNVFYLDPSKIPLPRKADLLKYVPEELHLVIRTWLRRDAESSCFALQMGKLAWPIDLTFVAESIIDVPPLRVESDSDQSEFERSFWEACEARLCKRPSEIDTQSDKTTKSMRL